MQNGFDRFPDDVNASYPVFNKPSDAYAGKWGLWVEDGVGEMQSKWDSWFSDFTSSPNNGVIDLLLTNDEWNQLYLIDGGGNPTQYIDPLMNPSYWADQIANPQWRTYEFFGKTMARWLEDLGDPETSLTAGHVDQYSSRDRVVGYVLYSIAKRWWWQKMKYDALRPYLPDCQLADYSQLIISEANCEPGDANVYPFSGWSAGRLPGTVNNPGNYLDLGRLDQHRDGQYNGYMWRPGAAHPDEPALMNEPFRWVIFAANAMRSIVRSSFDPVIAWVAPKSMSSGSRGETIYVANSDWYDECIIHTILGQQRSNLVFFNATTPTPADADEAALNTILLETRTHCQTASTIHSITKARTPYNAHYVVSAVYLDDTHGGVARVTFEPTSTPGGGVSSASFNLRGVPFTVSRPGGGALGAWVPFGPIFDIDNLTIDDGDELTFEQVNVIKLGGTNAMSFDEANALDFDQANVLPD